MPPMALTDDILPLDGLFQGIGIPGVALDNPDALMPGIAQAPGVAQEQRQLHVSLLQQAGDDFPGRGRWRPEG